MNRFAIVAAVQLFGGTVWAQPPQPQPASAEKKVVAVVLDQDVTATDPAPAQPADRPGPRNLKLRDLPENTWVELCKYEMDAGASEVPWCYDP
ncbi:MAG: hypothetical protein WD066_09040, partial [Planctomycetaceae bacterium]